MKKKHMNVWLSDAGCYPIICIISTSVILPVGFGLYMLGSSPDAR